MGDLLLNKKSKGDMAHIDKRERVKAENILGDEFLFEIFDLAINIKAEIQIDSEARGALIVSLINMFSIIEEVIGI